jgi:hypothetical protein
LFDQQGAGEPQRGGVVGEDPDDVRAAADLFVEALEWVGRAKLRPVRRREAVESEQVFPGAFEQLSDLGQRPAKSARARR